MAKEKNLHAGHRARMRKRFIEHGIDTFAQHELLEMLLYQSVPQRDTNETAHKLIAKFGSLAGVLNAPIEELKRAGVSEAVAVHLHLIPEVWRVCRREEEKKVTRLSSAKQVADFVVPLLRGSKVEEVHAIFIDAKSRILGRKLINQGGPTKVDVSIREIAQHALGCRATGVVIGHSHPSGSVDPSVADRIFTKLLYETLMSLDIVLMEHIIVGEGGNFFSFFSNGEIARLREDYRSKYPTAALHQSTEELKNE